jgi:hypothetical protein
MVIAASAPLDGCAVKHLVTQSIANGKPPVVVGGKTYAPGDMIKMSYQGSYIESHVCGDVVDGIAKQFSDAQHFAIAANNPDRDCPAAVRFFRDFLAAGTPVNTGGDFWQGMQVDIACGGVWVRAGRSGFCPTHAPGFNYPGGFHAQTMNGTNTPYSNAHGYGGFVAIAVGF